ncbi:MAG: NAD(P)-dependent oxidoreductase [Proteobacteria bacterium]|nr:NAD(P)-dependent oxidoreductase [Pseudomonadota bacterium]
MNLHGKTLFITGASRGIGLAIARRAAADGANIVVVAKTAEPDPRLPGTIHTAAAEIEAAGGQALPVAADIRHEASVLAAVAQAVARFGGIDILVNNASAISLTDTPGTPMKRFDLMHGVNARGTYLCTQACLGELIKSAQTGRNPHVLNLSPPLAMRTHWFQHHVAYSMAKYGMSLCTLGHAGEFRRHGIGVNSLWPRTAVYTSALQMIPGVDIGKCRKPQILADAAYLILTSDARQVSGNFFIDDALLAEHGVTDFEPYSVTPGTKDLIPDFFVD